MQAAEGATVSSQRLVRCAKEGNNERCNDRRGNEELLIYITRSYQFGLQSKPSILVYPTIAVKLIDCEVFDQEDESSHPTTWGPCLGPGNPSSHLRSSRYSRYVRLLSLR